MKSWFEHGEASFEEELEFWKHSFQGSGDGTRRHNFARSNGIEKYLEYFYSKNAHKYTRLLDVGSGIFSDFRMEVIPNLYVIAIDVLAHHYFKLREDDSVVRPIAIGGEDIGKFFPDNYFDIVYAGNSLDHTMSPKYVLHNIEKTLKPDGIFVCVTGICVSTRQKGQGLHQHDLLITPSSFVENKTGEDMLAGSELKIIDFNSWEKRTKLFARAVLAFRNSVWD